MDDRIAALDAKVNEDILQFKTQYIQLKQDGQSAHAKNELAKEQKKYKDILSSVTKTRDAVGTLDVPRFYKIPSLDLNVMHPDQATEGRGCIGMTTETGEPVSGVTNVQGNPVTGFDQMKERMERIRKMVFDTPNPERCEYRLNSTAFFWKSVNFRDLFIGSPMAQLEFLFYMMMCYDSRAVVPTYDLQHGELFGLDGGDTPADGHRLVTGAGRDRMARAFGGPTMRLPDEYRALAKCMMRDSEEKEQLLKYGIPFMKRDPVTGNPNTGAGVNRFVKWYDQAGNPVHPEIEFNVTEGGAAGEEGGNIAGIIPYRAFNVPDPTVAFGNPDRKAVAAGQNFSTGALGADGAYNSTTVGTTVAQNHVGARSYVDIANGDRNSDVMSMRGLNRNGFNLVTGVAGTQYPSPFVKQFCDPANNIQFRNPILITTGGQNDLMGAVSNVGAGDTQQMGLNTGTNAPGGAVESENPKRTRLSKIQNRYILTGNEQFSCENTFGRTNTNAVDAVKKGAIFASYFGEPFVPDHLSNVYVFRSGQGEIAGISNPVVPGGAAVAGAVTGYTYGRFHSVNNTGERNYSAGYNFAAGTVTSDNFGTDKQSVKNAWCQGTTLGAGPANAANLAQPGAGNGFWGNERGLGTTTYTSSRLSLLYDIVYSNPFGATNPIRENARGYVDSVGRKVMDNTLGLGEAPGHLTTPREFYVKCILGRYVMFWLPDGRPAPDCWDQEYYPAPGCVSQIGGTNTMLGDYTQLKRGDLTTGNAYCCTIRKSLPKCVHYAGRMVPNTQRVAGQSLGIGDDGYYDYDGSYNVGERVAANALTNASPATITPNTGVEKRQGVSLKRANTTVKTNFFCGDFSPSFAGTEAWNQLFQTVDNNGLAQFDGGYKQNPYMRSNGNDLVTTGAAALNQIRPFGERYPQVTGGTNLVFNQDADCSVYYNKSLDGNSRALEPFNKRVYTLDTFNNEMNQSIKMPGSQPSVSTPGALFNAYRGLFSPMNVPTNVEILAFCQAYATLIFDKIDTEKYPEFEPTNPTAASIAAVAERKKRWSERLATKMAASISKIRELIFTDDFSGEDSFVNKDGLIPNAEQYVAGENNPMELTSVNDGLPGGTWTDLFYKREQGVAFNGIISNPRLQEAIKRMINKMILARGRGDFMGKNADFPNTPEGYDAMVKATVRFNSEGILELDEDATGNIVPKTNG